MLKDMPSPCLLESIAASPSGQGSNTWVILKASRAGVGPAGPILPQPWGCHEVNFSLNVVVITLSLWEEGLKSWFVFSTSVFISVPNKSLKIFGSLTISHLVLFLKLGPVLHGQTQLCSPLVQNKKCGGKPEGKANVEATQHQKRHVLSQSFQAAAEAVWSRGFSIPGLVDMVASKCKGEVLWDLSFWVQHGTVYGVGSDPTISECVWCKVMSAWKIPVVHFLQVKKIIRLAQCGCWVLLPQKGSPQLPLYISSCNEEWGYWDLYLCLQSGVHHLCWA